MFDSGCECGLDDFVGVNCGLDWVSIHVTFITSVVVVPEQHGVDQTVYPVY
jgi:hypothetical protein